MWKSGLHGDISDVPGILTGHAHDLDHHRGRSRGGRLTKEEASKVARMAHDGLARTISPIHTMFDGDTLFCLATGGETVDVSAAGTAAAIAVKLAVLDAVRSATAAGGLPAGGL